MKTRKLWLVISLLLITILLLTACKAPEAEQPVAEEVVEEVEEVEEESGYQIPAVEEGKFNVAFVYVGPHKRKLH